MNKNNESSKKTILALLGGGVGILTIVGLFIAALQLWQSLDDSKKQENVQATLIALSNQQLAAQQTLVVLQQNANDVQQISDIEATISALDNERLVIYSTLTPNFVPQTSTNVPTTIVETPTPNIFIMDTPTANTVPTMTPTATISPNILSAGETWNADGLELTLESYKYGVNTVLLNWKVQNNSNQELYVKYFNENFTAVDNLGTMLNSGFRGCIPLEKIFKPGEIFRSGESNRCPLTVEVDMSNTKITEILITVSNLSRIEKAQWKVPIDIH